MKDKLRQFMEQQKILFDLNTFKITGVVLFRDNGIISKTIRFLTKGQFSHVGLLIENATKENFVYHSNGTAEQVLHRIFPRVQLNILDDDFLNQYDVVAYRLLRYPIDEMSVDSTLNHFLGVQYENNYFELVRSLWDLNKFNKDSEKSVFCSELVAIIFQMYGIINNEKCASNYLPSDFETSQLNGRNYLNPLQYFKQQTKKKHVFCC